MTTFIEALKAAVEAGIIMRRAQSEYFRTRTKEALIASKQAEKEYDRLAAAAMGKAEEQS